MNLKMIVATDKVGGIGKDGKLPWHCPEDLKLFKKKTQGKIVIMGHNTLKSLPDGKILPNRINVVLCRKKPEKQVTGAIYFHSVDEVLEYVGDKEAWVIGGSEIYKLFGNHIEEVHETNIKGIYNCDVFIDNCVDWNHFDSTVIYPDEFVESELASNLLIWKRISKSMKGLFKYEYDYHEWESLIAVSTSFDKLSEHYSKVKKSDPQNYKLVKDCEEHKELEAEEVVHYLIKEVEML